MALDGKGETDMAKTTQTASYDAAASIAAGLAELDALHAAYVAELDAADEADAIAAKMFAPAA